MVLKCKFCRLAPIHIMYVSTPPILRYRNHSILVPPVVNLACHEHEMKEVEQRRYKCGQCGRMDDAVHACQACNYYVCWDCVEGNVHIEILSFVLKSKKGHISMFL